MKILISFLIGLTALTSSADEVSTNVKYLHISQTECGAKSNFQGLVADGWGIVVAEITFGDNSYSARPLPISYPDLKILCENYNNIQDYDLVIRNFGMFEGGIVVGIQKKEIPLKSH